MTPFQEVDHTADLSLRVEASNLQGLFSDAARGMFSLMRCAADQGAEWVEREISLAAPDVESLLVDWLGELLFLHEVYGECLADEVIWRTLDSERLEATVRGHAGATSARGIKAVTYSYLQVTRTAEGYEATVTFDV